MARVSGKIPLGDKKMFCQIVEIILHECSTSGHSRVGTFLNVFIQDIAVLFIIF